MSGPKSPKSGAGDPPLIIVPPSSKRPEYDTFLQEVADAVRRAVGGGMPVEDALGMLIGLTLSLVRDASVPRATPREAERWIVDILRRAVEQAR